MQKSIALKQNICHSVIQHQQTLGALPDSTVVLIDGIVIHSTYSVVETFMNYIVLL